jgi:L,D-peptidoglycan transpeptidase YkuD (ErfK/YbiS/YcfS/YnhG family)
MLQRTLIPAILLWCSFSACNSNSTEDRQPPDYIPPQCTQLLWVQVLHPSDTVGQLVCFERMDAEWHSKDTFRVSIGRNGLAAAEGSQQQLTLKSVKQEGDGCSPAGLFPLLFVFGYAPSIATQMEYRTMQEDDICVDNLFSADYNQHVSALASRNNSHEKMRRKDEQYKLGIWVGYNAEPVVPGNGSCIFLHIWKKENAPTSGCTAMAEEDMMTILQWLDKDAHPYLLQTTP